MARHCKWKKEWRLGYWKEPPSLWHWWATNTGLTEKGKVLDSVLFIAPDLPTWLTSWTNASNNNLAVILSQGASCHCPQYRLGDSLISMFTDLLHALQGREETQGQLSTRACMTLSACLESSDMWVWRWSMNSGKFFCLLSHGWTVCGWRSFIRFH